MFQVDGEGLKFTNLVRMDVEPSAIDIIVDFEHIMAGTTLSPKL